MLVMQLAGNVALAGGLADPVAALILCTPGHVDLSVVNGEVVVWDGKLLTCDLEVSGLGEDQMCRLAQNCVCYHTALLPLLTLTSPQHIAGTDNAVQRGFRAGVCCGWAAGPLNRMNLLLSRLRCTWSLHITVRLPCTL